VRDHFRAVRAKKLRSKPYVPKPEGDPSRVAVCAVGGVAQTGYNAFREPT